MRRKNEIRCVGIVGSLDVARRRPVVAIWMGVINPEEFNSSFANLAHYTEQLFGRNLVRCRPSLVNILRPENVRQHPPTPGQQPAAFFVGLTSRVTQKLSSNVSRKSNSVHRAAITLDDFSLINAGLAFPGGLV